MARFALLGAISASLLPLGCVQMVCVDQEAMSAPNWRPSFGGTITCGGSHHCTDGAGKHIDQRCTCSRKCGCWGRRVGSACEDADEGSGACSGCGAGVADAAAAG